MSNRQSSPRFWRADKRISNISSFAAQTAIGHLVTLRGFFHLLGIESTEAAAARSGLYHEIQVVSPP